MRVVVGITAGHEVSSVAQALRGTGARSVRGPAPSLPDVLVADFPAGDLESTLRGIAALTGVRYAEPDELQSTLD